MTSLSRLEQLEYQCVAALAKPLTPIMRTKFGKALDGLRAEKRRLLAANPSLLRKLGTGTAPKDKPNALHPDETLGSAAELKVFRAPRELCGMTIHTVAGMMAIPNHGVVETHPDHADLHAELRGRGFRELHGVDRTGKTSTAAVAMFRPDRLAVIGANGGFLSAMHRRADVVPGEQRIESGGPGPAPQYSTSVEDFRAHYFGQRQ